MREVTTDPFESRALLARAQSGDERAFRELIEPYRRGLLVHAYRMLGSVADAEDVTQEALLRVWKALERFEPRASLRTWVFRITTNACLDELERRARLPQPVEPFPDELRGEADALIYEPAARYALREGMELALVAAIQLLPGRQRAVLILRDVLGWTGPEVAELLETTLAGVNSALQRARATVDSALPERAYAPVDPAEREIVHRYVDAWGKGDFDRFVDLLRADAEIRMPPLPTVVGAEAVARFLLTTAADGDLLTKRVRLSRANGRPALVVEDVLADGTLVPHGIKLLQVEDGRVAGYDAFIDPRFVAMFAGERDPDD
jgi:RNA polymerase sigma-70 factor (ECF subfamily)